jgi:hypothetical protein
VTPEDRVRKFDKSQLVRISWLLHEDTAYDACRLNTRPPAPGDVGLIIEIFVEPDGLHTYIVESTDGDGHTVWMGAFSDCELLPLELVAS